MTWQWFHRLSSPKWFYQISGRWLPWIMGISLLLFSAGLYQGLFNSPIDYQQGHTVRIMYLHVPTAFASMMFYVILAVAAAVGYIWRIKLAHMAAVSAAPVGAAMTFLALSTGALWGKPIWNTWWVWDARLTSELILLFLYLGFIALHQAFEDREVGDRAAGVLAMVGIVNIPIIHFSVEWWNTLHQGATISKFEKPSMDPAMLVALLLMIFAVLLFCTAIMMYRMRNEVLSREHNKSWVKEVVGQ
ncbi:heme ABC transporter permease [Aliikangiella coralliicola]|uniref:Heme exporter protein C n=1 Tax=Aliikangiella coralliicola TaxID=2592383 RepID=A0A545UAE5_9GAMM|nr:heme ABC transporter permease [Aliikangiella coralliicola]TQV86430.1 heme ABC transporter permease [Aliikangiella coralliicola]